MGPTLLCDKSTIQTLVQKAPELLHHYFQVNIPPILVREILGDLAKDNMDSRAVGQVKSLAKRVASLYATTNVDFRQLIEGEAAGFAVSFDRRPVVSGGKQLRSTGGEIGIQLPVDPTEQALNRWRDGDFKFSEQLASFVWRESKASLNWKGSLAKLTGLYSPSLKRRTTLPDTLEFVDDLMAASPDPLSQWAAEEFELKLDPRKKFRHHFLSQLPYAGFCIRGTLLGLWAMEFGLVSPKQDNQLDMEYLYYLPFCNAFATRDKCQKTIAIALLDKKQEIVSHQALAEDLSRLGTWLASLSDEAKRTEMQSLGPPESESSECSRLWKRFMGPDYRNRKRLKLTPAQEAAMMEHVHKLTRGATEIHDGQFVSVDDANFVFRTHEMPVTDPCPCRSGKPYKECHGRAPFPPQDNA